MALVIAFWRIKAFSKTTAGNGLDPSINDPLTRWRLTAATSNRKVTEDVTNENRGKTRQGRNCRRLWSMGERPLSHCLLLTKLMLQHKHTPSRSFYFQRAWLVSAEQKKEVKHGLDIYSQRLFKGYIQFQWKLMQDLCLLSILEMQHLYVGLNKFCYWINDLVFYINCGSKYLKAVISDDKLATAPHLSFF